jgi:hypothetical protein
MSIVEMDWSNGRLGLEASRRARLSRNRKILLFFSPQRAHIICRFQFSASRKKRDLLNITIRLICFLSLLMLNCSVGIVLPTIEVRFENLKADADVHIGTRGLPTILNSVTNIFEVQYPPPPLQHWDVVSELHISVKFIWFWIFVLFLDQGAANALRILPSRRQTMPILNGISGIIKPKRYSSLSELVLHEFM